MARIMREKKMHQKSFSKKKYKTWRAAETAAQRWVTRKKKELPPSQQNARDRMTKSNKSGVVGVCKVVKKIRHSGKVWEYPQWLAKWPDCPVRGGVRFTINDDLSEDDAFALAVISRQMESADLKAIRTRFNRIKGKKSHKEIMAMKKM